MISRNQYQPGDVIRVYHHPKIGNIASQWHGTLCVVVPGDSTLFLSVERLHDHHSDGLPYESRIWEVVLAHRTGWCGECNRIFESEDIDYLCGNCRIDN